MRGSALGDADVGQSVVSAGEILLGLVILAVLVLIALAARRALLRRGGGTFACGLRMAAERPRSGWLLGIARYSGDLVEWYRVYSFSPRPKRVFVRRDLAIRGRRRPGTAEAMALYADQVVVRCRAGAEEVELAMAEEALTGFLAWLEAAPPGRLVVGG